MALLGDESMRILDAADTARVLNFTALVAEIRDVCVEYARGAIACPERVAVPLRDGGVMLSMPAAAYDIAIHKLVTVCPRNKADGMPTILGQVLACDAASGEPLIQLDGPTVTGRRTAAVTLAGIDALLGHAPASIALFGTGKQAAHHVDAFADTFPGAVVHVHGRSRDAEARFCAEHAAAALELVPGGGTVVRHGVEVVVTATTSKTPVYRDAATVARLIVAVGAFTADAAEIDAATVAQSALVVDDPAGARHEAGDLILAGVDWRRVRSLADLVGGERVDAPVLFKTVGCAAWDLAACRVACRYRGAHDRA
jgi:1-piperideine-2-carboxylate/1-pyrroline-2-carboxylate reductase [NAD(P)H]